MKIQFLGAAETVTGSKYLLTLPREKLLVDCGMFQGFKQFRERNWEHFPFRPSEISDVLLTHAHIDHSGLLPVLVKEGFAGHIYCTHATRRLCEILLLDSAKLQEEDAIYANKKGFSKHKPALPLFTAEDVLKTMRLFKAIDFERPTRIGSAEVRFKPAGHILGAASISVTLDGLTTIFSGDLGRSDDVLMNRPVPFAGGDFVVCESTYGDRLHPKEETTTKLSDIINETLRRDGTVIIPSFAVGRSQVLLHLMAQLINNRQIPHVPVYLDSPMAIKATHLLQDHLGQHKLTARDLADIDRVTTYVETAEESKRVTLDRTPKIILSASGMATGGRVLHHLKAYLPGSRNTVVLVGHQTGGTRGASLANGVDTIKIHGEQVHVNAKVKTIASLSAHADKTQLLEWLGHYRTAKKVFLTHGDPEALEALRVALRDNHGIEASVPSHGKEVQLS